MHQSEREVLREVPGGARRADTFLLVIATLLTGSAVISFRNSGEAFIPLMFTALWLDTLAKWLRHVRPQYVATVEHFGTMTLGAALYAGWVSW